MEQNRLRIIYAGLVSLSVGKGVRMMRRKLIPILVGLVLLFGNAGISRAEVKRVQMHIAGYLCGN